MRIVLQYRQEDEMRKRATIEKHPTSIRLTAEAKELLALLAEKGGVSVAAWMETMIRREAKRQGIQVKQSEGQADA